MSGSDKILSRVTTVIVQALGVDEEDVTPSATLVGDLGAESIDFLDIVFRLEREFGITVPRGELFVEQAVLGDAGGGRDGQMTEDDLAALHSRMPYADQTELDRVRRLDKLTDLFTVELLVQYVNWKLEGGRCTASVVAAT